MADALMVLVILAFFAACVAYVGWCGRIIGPDPDDVDVADAPTPEAEHAVTR